MSTPTLRELIERATKGPYFVGHDDKDPGGNYHAHIGSGLAVVDTGREGDWPVARFVEWPNAQLIARCNPEVMARVLEFLEECAVAEDRSNLDGDSAEVVLGQLNDSAEELLDLLNATPDAQRRE